MPFVALYFWKVFFSRVRTSDLEMWEAFLLEDFWLRSGS